MLGTFYVRVFDKQLLRLLLLLVTLILLSNKLAIATGQFSLNPAKRIEAVIAESGVNRIQLQTGEVMEVVGDENKYTLHWSTDYRNLFITPKVEVGETIDISLLLTGGLVQDLRLSVVDSSSRTIIINNNLNTIDLTQKIAPSDLGQAEIAEMMRAMIVGEKGKYYISNTKRLIFQDQVSKVSQLQSYRYQDFSGGMLEVVNHSNKPITLLERQFQDMFINVIAINIEKPSLLPKSKGRVWLITKKHR